MATKKTVERQKTVQSMIPVRNGMTDKQRKDVCQLLNQQLADHYTLLTKTKYYHWNVEGPEFHDIHTLLDDHYAVIADMVDEIAEQSLKLGGQAAGTLAWFKEHSRIEEDPGETIPDTRHMVENLMNDHESAIECLHADIKRTDEQDDDAVTSNLLQDISAKHNRMAWMLRMILQKSSIDAYAVK